MTLMCPAHGSNSTSLSTTSAPKLSRQSKTHRLGKHLTQAIFKTTEKRSACTESEQIITGYAGHYSLFFSLSLSATPFCKTTQACLRAINGQNIRQCSKPPTSVHPSRPPQKKTLRRSRCSRLDTAQRSSSSSSSTAGTADAGGGHKNYVDKHPPL